MRYQKIIGYILILTVVCLFSSCLKDVSSIFNPGVVPAVVRQYGDSALTVATTRFGVIYATKLSSFSQGKCLLVSFDYDAALSENKDVAQTGYYTVDLLGSDPVNQQDAVSPLVSTSTLLPNEQPVPYAVSPDYPDYYVDLENYLFLPSICLTSSQQTLSWQLSYDPAQKPVVEGRKFIYSVFLRAYASAGRAEDDVEDKLIGVINAFNISKFINDMLAQGGRDVEMYLQVHYVNQINPKDSTRFTWGVTEPLLINK